MGVIGEGIPLKDSTEKARGEASYLMDYQEKEMHYGKILRSPYPHARILNIDVKRSRQLSGVSAVITHRDTPNIKLGVSNDPDKLPLESEKVRFIGDEVAAVSAVDEDTAEEALGLIEVEYEILPAVFDPKEAMSSNAPQIHDKPRNIASYISREFGRIEEGFKNADHVFEDTFTTHGVAHCCLEPHGCVASYSPPGQFKFILTTQNIQTASMELARALGTSIKNVTAYKLKVGGAFGGKLGIDPSDVICGLLSRYSGHTVKLVFSREEEFQSTRIRHPSTIEIRTGVNSDGRLVARQAKIIYENGAYNSHGPRVLAAACGKVTSLYGYTPHVKVEGYLVYTNNPYGGAFRGYGNPQITFAMESHMDIIAEKLGMDTKEFHLKNVLQPNTVTICGSRISSCGLAECIEKSSRLIGWHTKRHCKPLRGIGMAVMIHAAAGSKGMFSKSNFSDTLLKMNSDGSMVLLTGASDVGQGAETVLSQIVAEELGLSPADVNVEASNTAVTPVDLGSYASRVTFMAGNAAKRAASEVKKQLFSIAAEMFEANNQDLILQGGRIFVRGAAVKNISVREVALIAFDKGVPLTGKGLYVADYPSPDPNTGYGSYSLTNAFACHMVEVEVNPNTGRVAIVNYVAAHDSGKIINPLMARAQIEGAVVQGIGYCLTENLNLGEGRIVSNQFFGYRIPSPFEIPPIKVIFIETDDPNGPYGAKGLGEPGLVPVAPAILNAIYDACGVRIKDLPVTPEKILNGLQSRV